MYEFLEFYYSFTLEKLKPNRWPGLCECWWERKDLFLGRLLDKGSIKAFTEFKVLYLRAI